MKIVESLQDQKQDLEKQNSEAARDFVELKKVNLSVIDNQDSLKQEIERLKSTLRLIEATDIGKQKYDSTRETETLVKESQARSFKKIH